MTDRHRAAFATFIQESCSDLLLRLARSVGVPLVVLDADRGRVFATPDAAEDPVGLAAGGAPGISAPIETSEDVFGFLVTPSVREDLAPLVDALARELGSRLDLERDIGRMTDDLLQSYDQITLLYDFARILRPDESFEPNARRLLEETAALLDHRLLLQCFPRQGGIVWRHGPGLDPVDSLSWLTGDRAAVRAVHADLERKLKGKGAELDGPHRHRGTVTSPHGPIDYIAVPVWVKWEYQGFVGLFRDETERLYETGEVRLIETLAEELSNAATNQELNLDLRQLLFNVIRTLVAAIEAKDVYTRGHSERLVHLCRRMAGRLELSSEEIGLLSWAAILHDIGKIAVDDNVLNKPGKLTPEEYENIKAHPSVGARMLEPISQLQTIIPGIRHHHERFDGKGYPDGLAGEEIPLFARIIAVADTFDAIVSARSYRPASPPERALKVIRECAGTQFDPRIARVFLELVGEGMIEELEAEAAQPIAG